MTLKGELSGAVEVERSLEMSEFYFANYVIHVRCYRNIM